MSWQQHDTLRGHGSRPGEQALPCPVARAAFTGPAPAPRQRHDEPVQAFGESDRGCVRARNEDAFVVARLEQATRVLHGGPARLTRALARDSVVWLLAVADGMGGAPGGALASRVALQCLTEQVAARLSFLHGGADPLPDRVLSELEQSVRRCQRSVQRAAEDDGVPGRPGTTLTAVCARFPDLYLAHAGDSRCYLYRDGDLVQLSHDQTLATALGAEVEHAAQLDHILCNAVGGDDLPVEVERLHLTLAPRDVVFLCSDGVYGYIDDEELSGLLAAVRDTELSVEACVGEVIRAANARGGGDNLRSPRWLRVRRIRWRYRRGRSAASRIRRLQRAPIGVGRGCA